MNEDGEFKKEELITAADIMLGFFLCMLAFAVVQLLYGFGILG